MDLGVLKDVCIARPGRCHTGGAIVFWLNKTDGDGGAFMSSLTYRGPSRFLVSNAGSELA